MRKFYFFIALFLSVCNLIAQPILEKDSLKTGTSFNLYLISNANIANLMAPGANVTWDISASTATLAGTAEFLDIAATPHAAQYPTATVALKFTTGSNVHYSLFSVSAGSMEEVANNVGTTSEKAFPDPRATLRFPYSYGMTINDTYQKSGQASKIISLKYDAYGSLNTSLISTSNTVRIFTIDDGDTSANWWSSSPLVPQFQANGAGLVLWKLNASTGIDDLEANDLFDIYPNPATDHIRIINKKAISEVEVFNMSGQLQTTTDQSFIDVSMLPKGTYIIKATTESEVATMKLIKQ